MAGPDRPPDLVELLEADHRRVTRLLADADVPAEGDADVPAEGDAAASLVREIASHLVAESQLLYPTLRRHLPEADVAVDALVETDHRLEELIADVDRGGGADVDRALEALFAEHVRQQEALFAELRQVVEPEELLRLAEALGPTLMEAPTHPHPHLPREGVFEVISDAVASGVDHVRDALKREEPESG